MVSCLKITISIALIAILIPFIYKYKDRREYNYRTTAEEAIGNIYLNGTTIIVTGSNTGIGKPTVRVLLCRGAQIIMACRNKKKAMDASKDIINTILSSDNCKNNEFCDRDKLSNNLDVMVLDLGSLHSIDTFSEQFINKYSKLNYLILNAGTTGLFNKWSSTKDGIERVFGVNHIGHYYLTMKLSRLLIETALKSTDRISRVIVVASAAHQWSPSNITEWLINDKKVQDPLEYGYVNYGFSKMCNILFAKEYNDRFNKQNVFAVSLHPGVIATELGRNRPFIFQWIWKNIASKTVLKSWSQGAATTIRTIALNDKQFIKYGGQYFVDCNAANDQLRTDLFADNMDRENKAQFLMWKLTNNILKNKGKTIDPCFIEDRLVCDDIE